MTSCETYLEEVEPGDEVVDVASERFEGGVGLLHPHSRDTTFEHAHYNLLEFGGHHHQTLQTHISFRLFSKKKKKKKKKGREGGREGAVGYINSGGAVLGGIKIGTLHGNILGEYLRNFFWGGTPPNRPLGIPASP